VKKYEAQIPKSEINDLMRLPSLAPVFAAIGDDLTAAFARCVYAQIDLFGARYSKVAPSTLAARAELMRQKTPQSKQVRGSVQRTRAMARKTRALDDSAPDTRLLFTGVFAGSAFQSACDETKGTLSISNDVYSSPAIPHGNTTFADIVRYNTAESPEVNRGIKDPPVVFPVNQQQFMAARDLSGAPLIATARARVQSHVRSHEFRKAVTESILGGSGLSFTIRVM
jgi:hypothetical protein